MGLFKISAAVLEKEFLEDSRYRTQYISNFLINVLVLTFILMGGNNMGDGNQVSMELLGGYMMFQGIRVSMQTAYRECEVASYKGNFESMMLFSVPFYLYLTIVSFIRNIKYMIIYTIAAMVSSLILGMDFFSVHMLWIIPFYLIALFSGIGIGLIFAGLQLVYKKIDSIVNFIIMVLSFILPSIKANAHWLIEMIPMKSFISIFKIISRNNVLPASRNILILIATSCLYYFLGVVVFNRYMKKAKVQGSLGLY